ncbi:TetR/AcrR family transcriptional regulator [Actinophytocola sediminis]
MPAPKTRRRGERLEQAILEAAWAELAETGYAGLTIEAVAARAATSKTVIYRRWSSRAALVVAAWNHQTPTSMAAPDTGALRTDLIELFGLIARRVDTMMSELIAGVMGEAFRHPEVAELLRERLRAAAPLYTRTQTIVDRAAERGELPPTRVPQRAARIPLDLIRGEAMTCGAPVSEAVITELVDDVYLPLLHGLSTPRVQRS